MGAGRVRGGRRSGPGLAGFTFLWGLAVAVIGMLRARWLPGELHWVIKTLHCVRPKFGAVEKIGSSGNTGVVG